MPNQHKPQHLDLDKQKGLRITWNDNTSSFYPIAYLRKHSPSADQRELRKEMNKNPLTVLPASAQHSGPITATNAELMGNYAIRIEFSDGHRTGIYSWDYLKALEIQNPDT